MSTSITSELKINPKSPSGLYQLLNAVSLAAARIRAGNAMQGAKALKETGWTTPDKMLDTTWEDRVKVLNQHGYARFDESRARFLEHNAKLVKDKYKGNLHNLLREAKGSPAKVKQLVQEFKGIGPTGANIFYREVKPMIDKKAFERGFVKAAMSKGIPPLKAVELLKKANEKAMSMAVGAGVGALAGGAMGFGRFSKDKAKSEKAKSFGGRTIGALAGGVAGAAGGDGISEIHQGLKGS